MAVRVAVCGGLALISLFLVISAAVGAWRWLSRDCEACVCRRHDHSSVVSTHILNSCRRWQCSWSHTVLCGECWAMRLIVSQQARASSPNFTFCTYGALWRARGHAHTTHLYDVIFVIFSIIMLNAYAYLLCSKLRWHNLRTPSHQTLSSLRKGRQRQTTYI